MPGEAARMPGEGPPAPGRRRESTSGAQSRDGGSAEPVATAAIAAAWTGAVLFVLLASVPDHPLRRTHAARQALVALAPQGWAFFTRDPREPLDRVYRREGRAWVEATHTNGSPRGLLGLGRGARALHVELASLLGQAPASRWQECAGGLGGCAGTVGLEPVAVSDDSTLRALCGEILVLRAPPVPWAWSRSGRSVAMPARAVRLDVACAPAAGGPARTGAQAPPRSRMPGERGI